jgi:hypothetical protein
MGEPEAPLQHLIAEAVALGGGDLCAAGHDWRCAGGRACPHGRAGCSQTVYQCARCGEYDYGEPGGPGWRDCHEHQPDAGEEGV